MFTVNVGPADRIIRILLGLALVGFAIFAPVGITWKWVGWIGLVAIATAFLGTCPLYSVLGLSSAAKRR